MTSELLARLLAARAQRQSCVVATRLDGGTQQLFIDPIHTASDPVAAAAQATLEAGRSRRIELGGAAWFLHLHASPPLLLLIGAVHIAQSLVPMARMAGATVVVGDPRRGYATAERFPDTTLLHDWPDRIVHGQPLDASSAVVALSHDPKLDDPALAAALQTTCGYIGALGSTRSHAARLQRLAALGVANPALARLRGPVGLDIRAEGAAEIAVAILAEWIAYRRGGTLRDR